MKRGRNHLEHPIGCDRFFCDDHAFNRDGFYPEPWARPTPIAAKLTPDFYDDRNQNRHFGANARRTP